MKLTPYEAQYEAQSVLRCWTFLFASLLLSSTASGASPSHGVTTERDCLELNTNHASYRQAATGLVNTSFVQKWIADLGAKRLALGNNVDRTEFVAGRCYWLISIYENDDEHMLLWNAFRVGLDGKETYLLHEDGKAVSLKRQQNN